MPSEPECLDIGGLIQGCKQRKKTIIIRGSTTRLNFFIKFVKSTQRLNQLIQIVYLSILSLFYVLQEWNGFTCVRCPHTKT